MIQLILSVDSLGNVSDPPLIVTKQARDIAPV